MADLQKKFKYDLFNHCSCVIAAVSGGADSMFLLLALIEFANSLESAGKLKVIAAHFNHNIRKNASRDEEFVRTFCQKNAIEFRCGYGDVPAFSKSQNISIETAARQLRFQYLQTLRKEYQEVNSGEVLIATAHHADDNVETLVMNLLRGSGMQGLCGIKKRNGYIAHPMLSYTKDEILSYIKRNNIPFVHDETNDLHDVLRNRIRLELIPLMEELRPCVKQNILRCSEIISVENEYINSVIEERYLNLFKFDFSCQKVKILTFPRKEAQKAHKAAARRIALKAYELLGIYKDIEFKTIERTTELFQGRTGNSFDFLVSSDNISGIEGEAINHPQINGEEQEEEELSLKTSIDCGKKQNKNAMIKICVYLNAENVAFIAEPAFSELKSGEIFLKIDIAEIGMEHVVREISNGVLTFRMIECSNESGNDGNKTGDEGNRIKADLINGNKCSKNIGYLDAAQLGGELIVRRRKNGDTFFPVNAPGRKKLKEIFIDAKLPSRIRDEIPIIESNGEIVFVPGIRSCEFAKVTENTDLILEIVFCGRLELGLCAPDPHLGGFLKKAP